MRQILYVCLFLFSLGELLSIGTFARKGEKTALKLAVSSLVFLWLIFIGDHFLNLNIPDIVLLFLTVSLFSGTFLGYYVNLYNKSKVFDRIQHAMGSFSFALFLYYLLASIFEYGGSKSFRAFYILLLGIATGMFFELSEFVSDLNKDKKMQRGLRDTNFDMVSDVLGGVLAAVFAYFLLL